MRLSTRGRYATRAMFELAMHYQEGPVQLHQILDRQEISMDYLTHLFKRLRDAGLIQSVRGPRGGYFLAKPPGEIKIGDIVEITEGTLSPADCVAEEECHRADGCIARLVWQRLGDKISQFLNSITLEDLCSEAGLDCSGKGGRQHSRNASATG